jgi:hypothetical protein
MLSNTILASLAAIDSDWRLIPCDDRKRPVNPSTGQPQEDWAQHTYDLDDFLPLADSPYVHAVGLVLGPVSGTLAIDFDGNGSVAAFKETYNRPYSDLPKTVGWSSGRPNRRQLAYRVPLEYHSYLRNRRFWKRDSRVVLELRWAGHQSVIAGAHPDTAGYHWLPGQSPSEVELADAPDWLLEPLFKKPEEPAAAEYTPSADDADRAIALLSHIQPRDDYHSWLSVGMALHSVDPGLLTSWVEWSKGCSSFNEEECLAKWASFKGTGVTIGTLHYFAEQDGFIHTLTTDDDDFIWDPPSDRDQPSDTSEQPAPSPDPQPNAGDQAIDALNDDIEHARARLQQQLNDLQADIDLGAILPMRLAQSLIAKGESMSVHPAAFLGPLLTATSSVIGNRARVTVNAGWSEPFVIWAGNILPPSAMKSAIADVIGKVIIQFQIRDLDRHNQDKREARDQGTDPEDIPSPRRWMVSDATYERIAQLIAEPKTLGLLSYQDELMGWFERLDARQSAGARAGWLSFWTGSPAIVDRKVAASSFASSSAVSLFGNVQPDRLITMITSTDDDASSAGDGLWARFLWCRPPQAPWRYRAQGLSISRDLQRLISALDSIPHPVSPDLCDDGSTPLGLDVRISPEVTEQLAAPQWESWADDAAGSSNPARAAFLGKLRGYSVRLAGLLYLLDLAEAAAESHTTISAFCTSDPLTAQWYVDVPAASMTAALTLASYYLQQFDAIQAEMGSGELSGQVARFLRRVADSGVTTVAPRDVLTWRIFGRKKLTTVEALRFLRQLVEVYGHGQMVPGTRKGSMVWQVSDAELAD